MQQHTKESNVVEVNFSQAQESAAPEVKAKTRDGYFMLANTMAEAICKAKVSGRQMRVFFAVIRQTYGWQKEFDYLSPSEIANMVDCRDVSSIRADLRELKARQMIITRGRLIGPNPVISNWDYAKKQGENAPKTGRKHPANRVKTPPTEPQNTSENSAENNQNGAKTPCSEENQTGRKHPENEVKTPRKQGENALQNGVKTPPTKDKEKHITKNTKTKGATFVAPDWLDGDLFAEYIAMRNKIRKPLTDHAKNLAVNALRKLIDQGYVQADVINRAIERNWLSFYPYVSPCPAPQLQGGQQSKPPASADNWEPPQDQSEFIDATGWEDITDA